MLVEAEFIDTVLESDDLLEVFEVIYNGGGCVEAFHKKQGSRSVKITGWNDSGERTVWYSVAIQAPTIITNTIGTGMDLEETQRVLWTSISGEVIPDPFTASTPGSVGMSSTSSKTSASDLPCEPPISFTVTCTPKLISGGGTFFTELEFHFRKRAAGMGGGIRAMCSIKVDVQVWGIQSTLEPWMMSEAKKNLTAFFPFMSEFFRMHSKAATTAAILEPEGPAEPAWQRAGSWSATSGAHSKDGSKQIMISPAASCEEEFFDAEQAVPRGVRAAVQMFEGGNVMGKGAVQRPVARSRSSSPQGKLTRLPIHSALEAGGMHAAPQTPASPGAQPTSTPPTPHSARSPLTHEAHARRTDTAPSESASNSELTPRLDTTFTFRRKVYSKGVARRTVDESSDRDRIDSPSTIAHVIPPSTTDTNASTCSDVVFPQSSLDPRFPGFDSDPPAHNASLFAMRTAPSAAPSITANEVCGVPTADGDHLTGGPAPGPAAGCTWSQKTEAEGCSPPTDASLALLFHDAAEICDRARRASLSGDSGAQSQSRSQSTLFESAAPESVSTSNSITNLQEDRFRLCLERVTWKLGSAEQRIDELSQRVRDCVALVHDAQDGSEAGGPPRSEGGASRVSMGLRRSSGSMLGFCCRRTEAGSERSRLAHLLHSSAGSSRSTASSAALATAGGFAVGVALGVGAVAGIVLLRPSLQH